MHTRSLRYRSPSPTILVLSAILPLSLGCSSDDTETTASDTFSALVDASVDIATVDIATADDSGATDTGADDASGADTSDTQTWQATDCGEPWFSTMGGLKRYPYLQTVTPTEARVLWTTLNEATGTVEIQVGEDEWRTIDATRETFAAERTLAENDYWAYEARIDGLAEGTTYCYRVLQDGLILAEGLHMTTAWTSTDRPLRILAFGDSGNGSVEQADVRDAFMAYEFDVFLHLGDMAYGSGTFTEFESYVFTMYRDLLHKTPSWPTMGNHEFKTDAGQPYLDVYSLPEMAPREEEQERYYSFDYGNVHMVSIDSNDTQLVLASLYQTAGEANMFEWLEQDLAASDKPWKIAFFHHPPYSSSERDPNYLVIDNLLPILEAGGVDLVLSGHDHHTERTRPIWQGQIAEDDPRALTYIVAGAGGAGLREATGDWWTAFVDKENHTFVSITIDGCTLTGQAIARTGTVTDTFEITNCGD